MNEDALDAPSLSPSFKNRYAGLVIFGILVALLGCLCALLVPLCLFSMRAAAQSPTPPPPVNILGIVAVYGCAALVFIWLGIGSIMARRWARALLIILSWGWLFSGVAGIGTMIWMMPKLIVQMSAQMATVPNHQSLPPGFATGILVGMLGFLSIFFIIVPAILIFFYSSRHVKATCEHRDPVPRWTDRCPLPVLGLSIWVIFAVLMFLIIPLTMTPVVPFFGVFLKGLPAVILYFVYAIIWLYAAWALYKLQPAGWWTILIAWLLVGLSSVLTFMRHDMLEMYRLMNYSQAQLNQMDQTGMLRGHFIPVMTIIGAIPFLAYLIFIKRYFRRPA